MDPSLLPSLAWFAHVLPHVVSALEAKRGWDTAWLALDKEQRSVRMQALPDEGAVLFPLDVQLVIEFYAQGS
jgi:hypothetical protein